MSSSIKAIKDEKRILLTKYLDECNNEFLNQNNDAIFILDLEGKIVHVNPSFEKLTGYVVEEAIQMRLQTLIPIEDLDKVYNFFHKTMLGQFENFDCKLSNKIDEIIDINVMMIPLAVDNQVLGVHGVARDITPLKSKKREIKKIEEIHRALTENVLDIIISTNIMGEVLYISPSCENTLGYTPNELTGKHFLSLFFQEDIEAAGHKRKNLLAYQKNSRGSYRILNKDGGFVWTDIICNPIVDPVTQNITEVISVIRDITEQKKSEVEVRRRKKAFREIIEHSPNGVIIAKNTLVKYINETGIKLFGASNEEEIMNRSLLEFIDPDYHKIALTRAKNVSDGDIAEFLEYKINRKDGTIIDVEIKAIPTFFEDDEVNCLYIRDLTERKKTQNILLQAEKMNIAGQLAAGIAHEVRNPLTAIKGFLQLMNAEMIEKKTYFDIIQSEMDRIELILNELLTLAKPKDLNMNTVEIQNLIQDVKTLIDTQAIMNNITIDILIDFQEILPIQCDQNQIKQVFINFLKNSIEAMESGGLVSVELKKHGLDKIKILIKDTGPGIPHHILHRLGEPFFTTKENGTGLGIMISRQIIVNHNGSLNIWSDDKGTVVEIILPYNKSLK